MARLIFGTPTGEQAIELKAFNGLGRHPSNSVQLMDKIASKEHCIVEQRGTQFVLRDLGSLNGTYVNGQRVTGERMLRHGDEIELGMTRARYDDGVSPRTYPRLPVSPDVVQSRSPGGGPVQSQVPTPTGPSMAAARPAPAGPPPRQEREYTMLPSTEAGKRPAPQAMGRGQVSLEDGARSIGAEVRAGTRGFMPFDQVAQNAQQLRTDYEQMRMMVELTREIGLEHDFEKLLQKVLRSLFRFVAADRGVVLIMGPDGGLKPAATFRRDGSDTPIKLSSTLLGRVIRDKASVLTADAAGDFGAMNTGKSMVLNRIASAIVVPLLHESDIYGAVWLDSEVMSQFRQKDLELVTAVAGQAAMFIANNVLERQIEKEAVTRERLSRLLSPNVAEQVISGKLDVRQGGVHLDRCTVFNSDIRGFTRMSEGISPDFMVEMLNEYFQVMVEILFRHDGTLDKFMGDGIMALFGAPAARPDDAVRSIRVAVEMMEELARFNRSRQSRGIFPFEIGIGIHTGPLVAGYVGSSKSLSYTVIGDTANTSARLCGIAAAGQILISEQTADLLGGQFKLEELPPAHLKNKEKPLRLFNVRR
jgi:adenylate cyclase